LRRNDGYTLIEVLVALVIFVAMLGLAGAALNQGLTQYRGLVDKGLNFWDHAKKIWLDKSFNSMTDYYVFTEKDRWFPYFKGDLELMSYVTLAPLVGELPVAVWLRKEQGPNNKFLLQYYEMPVLTKKAEDLEGDTVLGGYRNGPSYRILSEMDQIDFGFYSCETPPSQICGWNSTFEGSKAKLLPQAVRIAYRQGNDNGFMLFYVNVNSPDKKSYNEARTQE
jgi:general secretion pathway protein J